MHPILAYLSEHSWLWEEPRNAIWVAGLAFAYKTIPRLALWIVRRANRSCQQRARYCQLPHCDNLSKKGWAKSFIRGIARRESEWIRAHRFDQVWINREVSRAHTALSIFVTWTGLWLIALGMKESLFSPEGTLVKSPVLTLLAALPVFFFEFHWLRCSSRASRIISYRRKVHIWRWRQ